MQSAEFENSSLSFDETIDCLAKLVAILGNSFSKESAINSELCDNGLQLLHSALFHTLIQPDWSVPGEERYQLTNDASKALLLLENSDNPAKAMKFIALGKISLFLPKSVSEMDDVEKSVLAQNIKKLQDLLQ